MTLSEKHSPLPTKVTLPHLITLFTVILHRKAAYKLPDWIKKEVNVWKQWIPGKWDSWSRCTQGTGRCWHCPRRCTSRDSQESCSGRRCRSYSPPRSLTLPSAARILQATPAARIWFNSEHRQLFLRLFKMSSSKNWTFTI